MRRFILVTLLASLLATGVPGGNQRMHCDPVHVFLVHGIAQNGGENTGDMEPLLTNLVYALDGQFQRNGYPQYIYNYVVTRDLQPSADIALDDTFNFGSCAKDPGCQLDGNTNCDIASGATQLDAQIVARTMPGSRVIIIAYSMGGLVARSMFVSPSADLQQRNVLGLITLASPSIGYPWDPNDNNPASGVFYSGCRFELAQMGSDFVSGENIRPQPSFNPFASFLQLPKVNYLRPLNQAWATAPLALQTPWIDVTGFLCNNGVRFDNSSYGCPSYNMWSDGVVCDQSGTYDQGVLQAVDNQSGMAPGNPPDVQYGAYGFGHASFTLMCGSVGDNNLIYKPGPGTGGLLLYLVSQIAGWVGPPANPGGPGGLI